MADRISPEARSRLMMKVGSRNTGPELHVRSLLHLMGYRFRLHRKDLPGTPDIVLPGRRTVVFVHGCFWHGHECRADKMPKSRTEYWGPKIDANRSRDIRKRRELRKLGWRVLVIWECDLKDENRLGRKLSAFLER